MSFNSSNISKVDNLVICSLNVRGLSSEVKRRETFNWLRNEKYSVLPGFKTDHSLITLSLGTKTNPRGPGFWKLNSHFLKDLEYINLIKETINVVLNDYKEDESVDAILLWDVMKMQIRAVSIKYAKQLKAKQKRTEKTLETEILMLERKLENNLPEIEKREIRTKLEIKKQSLEQWIDYKTQG